MYEIDFYADRKGNVPVREYIKELAGKKDKDSRIKLNKIRDYIRALAKHGATLGEPYMKKISGELWELRPLSDRIMFAAWTGNRFLLISHFVKKRRRRLPQKSEKRSDF